MAFNIVYQLKTKKFWWTDIVFYFAIIILLAIVIVYSIFSIKVIFQTGKIQSIEEDIAKTGTPEQKETERKVFEYQKKINNFSTLLAAHKISSNVFRFIEQSTFSNVWFSSFSLNPKEFQIKLAGETEDALVLARQISFFEKEDFIKNVKLSGFSLGLEEGEKVKFSLVLSLDPQMFVPAP